MEQELEGAALRSTQIIINEADRLQSLVDSMLGPNKLPRLANVNIHTLLERVRNLVTAEFGSEVQFGRDYDPSIPELLLDSDRIIQALLNIMRNAARAVVAVANGEIVLRTRILRQFTIGHRRHRLVVQIVIGRQLGQVYQKEIREKVFYPMVTASDDGMGLGSL